MPPPSLCIHIPLPDVTWYHCTWQTSHTSLLCIYILAALKILETVMVWNKANPCAVMSGEWHIPSWSLSKQGSLGTRLGCSFNHVRTSSCIIAWNQDTTSHPTAAVKYSHFSWQLGLVEPNLQWSSFPGQSFHPEMPLLSLLPTPTD